MVPTALLTALASASLIFVVAVKRVIARPSVMVGDAFNQCRTLFARIEIFNIMLNQIVVEVYGCHRHSPVVFRFSR